MGSFAKYSVPEKEDGFDEIKYDWADSAKSKEYMKTWIMEKKTSTRVEDLVPSPWFKQKSNEWEKAVRQWTAKLSEYKSSCAKKVADKNRKIQAAAAAVAKAKKEEERKAKLAAEGKEDDKKEDEAKPMEVEEEEVPEVPVDFAGLDVFEVA